MKWSALPLLIIPAVWVALIVWSVRTFWRTSDDPRQARILGLTKFTCAFVTLGSAIFFPLDLPIPDGSYMFRAAYWAFFVFPVSLCVGYLSSRLFFAIVDPLPKK